MIETLRGQHYMRRELYDRLIAAVLQAKPSIITGEVGPDEMMIAIGEHGGIWPEAIAEDACKDELEAIFGSDWRRFVSLPL